MYDRSIHRCAALKYEHSIARCVILPYEITRATTVMYMQRYIEFALDSYAKLNLPYPFSVSLGYIASPVLMQGEIFLAFDDDHQTIGCLSFIRGTAEENYSNREIVQIQLLYIDEHYRSSTLLRELLSMLVQCLRYLEEPVKELHFWTGADDQLQALITKRFSLQPRTYQSVYGTLHYYVMPFEGVGEYISTFPNIQYF